MLAATFFLLVYITHNYDMCKYTDPLRTFNDCGQIRRIIVFPCLYLITGCDLSPDF